MDLSHTRRGLPKATITIPSPKGAKRWSFVFDRGAPRLLAGPRTWPKHVQAALSHWTSAITAVRTNHRAWTSEARRVKPLIEAFLAVSQKTLVFDTPGARPIVAKQAQAWNRLANDQNGPQELREAYLEGAGRLADLLRRTGPPKRQDGGGPTPETEAKFRPDLAAIETFRGHHLDAALEICQVWRALTKKLDAKNVNLEATGGGTEHGFKHPIETMSGAIAYAYQARYKPWSEEQTLMRAVPHRRPSHFQVILSVLVERVHFDDADRHYHLPPGRARAIVWQGLGMYPRVKS